MTCLAMKIKLNNETIEVEYSGEIKGLLKKLNIQRETVVVAKNGKIVPENETVSETDLVDIIRIIYGG